jgi:hypothetical protein
MSERTKSLAIKKVIISTLHYLCMFGPIISFVIYGFCSSTVENGNKVILTLLSVTGIILALISLVVNLKYRAGIQRTVMWVMTLGILNVLNNASTFIWILAITSIIDEILFVPALDKLKRLVETNKEIDRRL